MQQYDGILLCNKPYRLSSHDLINHLRRIVGQKKIGHTGTLDPRATGLLIICMGRATKISQFLTEWDKTYEAEITLGRNSTTYDSEGIIDAESMVIPSRSEEEIDKLLDNFRGRIMQKVPLYSAAKVKGKRLYKMARQGKSVDTPERMVDIKELQLLEYTPPALKCLVTCSKGTYIRSLAFDIGARLGCGAYLSSLCRTRVGDFRIEQSFSIDDVQHLQEAGELQNNIISMESTLNYPIVKITSKFAGYVISGKVPDVEDIVEICGSFESGDLLCLKDGDNRLMAIVKAQVSANEFASDTRKNLFSYVRVLN